jgi:3',5'-cyclic AMP phosphodiesterase CpdA
MATPPSQMRLIHVSDIHVWRYAFNPIRLFSKRLLGMGSLLVRRASQFRLERLGDVVNRVASLEPDHILITGDLTTTALPIEFRAARHALGPWLTDPEKVTILPGNHDRYTVGAHRDRRFEQYFGPYAPGRGCPWLRRLDPETAILGLDPTRASLTARGFFSPIQLDRAREVLAKEGEGIRRLVVACHYPLQAPDRHRRDLEAKRLIQAELLGRWLATLGPHLYCCGHVHAAWAFVPDSVPNQLCLNAGAPLLRDPTGECPPGFLEIRLRGDDVTVDHHAWQGGSWFVDTLVDAGRFFAARTASTGAQPPSRQYPDAGARQA